MEAIIQLLNERIQGRKEPVTEENAVEAVNALISEAIGLHDRAVKAEENERAIRAALAALSVLGR